MGLKKCLENLTIVELKGEILKGNWTIICNNVIISI
jgi:hypothetical protein